MVFEEVSLDIFQSSVESFYFALRLFLVEMHYVQEVPDPVIEGVCEDTVGGFRSRQLCNKEVCDSLIEFGVLDQGGRQDLEEGGAYSFNVSGG
jgi:hypothetical protein